MKKQIKIIIENLLCVFAVCAGILTGILSPLIFAIVFDKCFGPSVRDEYEFYLDTISSYEDNRYFSSFTDISSKKGFDDLSLYLSFPVNNEVHSDAKQDLEVVYSIKIKDYETQEIIYDLKDIYTYVCLRLEVVKISIKTQLLNLIILV